jgi:hypothetical protein
MSSKKSNKSEAQDATPATPATPANPVAEAATPSGDAAVRSLFSGPSSEILALIQSGKAQRRNMPKMVKPSDIPVGGMVVGEIVRFVNSPVSTIKGKLVWLKLESGQEITFPVTGVIRAALSDNLDEEIGKILIAKREESIQNKKFGRDMYLFTIFTTEKSNLPVDKAE